MAYGSFVEYIDLISYFVDKNWADAQADCMRDNGNLASLTIVQESAFVVTLVNKNYSYWIGLSDTKVMDTIRIKNFLL